MLLFKRCVLNFIVLKKRKCLGVDELLKIIQSRNCVKRDANVKYIVWDKVFIECPFQVILNRGNYSKPFLWHSLLLNFNSIFGIFLNVSSSIDIFSTGGKFFSKVCFSRPISNRLNINSLQ